MEMQHPPGFDDMKLQVGERLQVALRRNPKMVYYPTLIGYVRGEYILLKLPFDHGLAVPMLEGEEVLVRVFSGIAVHSFDSVIESLQLSPRYQMYLAFPTEIQAIPLRDAPRVPVSLPVMVRTPSHPAPAAAMLTDLSISGGMLTADAPIARPGEAVVLTFSFRVKPTNQEINIQAKATVRGVQQLHGNLPNHQGENITFSHGIGFQFEDLAPKDLVMVQHYIYEQIL
jgi:hypothetical protein